MRNGIVSTSGGLRGDLSGVYSKPAATTDCGCGDCGCGCRGLRNVGAGTWKNIQVTLAGMSTACAIGTCISTGLAGGYGYKILTFAPNGTFCLVHNIAFGPCVWVLQDTSGTYWHSYSYSGVGAATCTPTPFESKGFNIGLTFSGGVMTLNVSVGPVSNFGGNVDIFTGTATGTCDGGSVTNTTTNTCTYASPSNITGLGGGGTATVTVGAC